MPNQRKNGYLGSPDFVEPHIYALSFRGKIAYIGKSTGGKRGYFTGGVIPNKIGKEKFIKGVIEYCDVDQLNNREIHWIKKFEPRFNLATGGQGGLVGDANPAKRQEVKEKISKALKNRPLSEEHKQKLVSSEYGLNELFRRFKIEQYCYYGTTVEEFHRLRNKEKQWYKDSLYLRNTDIHHKIYKGY